MSITVEAVYENGVLKPVRALPLKEREKVQVTVHSATGWVDETAGMLGWKGSHEELRHFALAPELDPEESA